METIKHGERVTFTHRLTRRTERRQATNARGYKYETWKYWAEYPLEGEGLFLGVRTLKNGTRYWEEEIGYLFEPKEYFQVALISPDTKTNPIYVPLNCCQPANNV